MWIFISRIRICASMSFAPAARAGNRSIHRQRRAHHPSAQRPCGAAAGRKSQHKNKAKALKVLRARLYEQERARRDAERAASRKSQVGSGDRSERIRTYKLPEGRVTDHRINLTLYKIDKVMSGEALDEIIDALIAEDQATPIGGGRLTELGRALDELAGRLAAAGIAEARREARLLAAEATGLSGRDGNCPSPSAN